MARLAADRSLMKMTSVKSGDLWLSFVCAVLLAACRGAAQTDLNLPAQVVVVSGAIDVRPEKKADGTSGVSYQVHESFPADALLAHVRAALPAPEWEPMPMDWMNPDLPSSHQRGWTSFADGTKKPPARVHQWIAQWRGKSGDVVFYSLKYDSPLLEGKSVGEVPDRPDNDLLHVTAMRLPKAAADRLMSWADSQRKQIEKQ
jgi:hypothetical protein